METQVYINTANKYTLDLSLWLDDYDDIYSDFDSRHFLKRRVSADFIEELRIALKNKNKEVNDLVLLLPEEKRNMETEQKIVQSLKSYFNRQMLIFKNKYKHHLKKGILIFIVAITFMVVNSIINLQLKDNLLASILRIIVEPAGWFLVWVSFDMLYYDLKSLKKESRFFRELGQLEIYFQSSESSRIN